MEDKKVISLPIIDIEKVHELARDIVMDKVFIDRFISEPDHEWNHMLRAIFLPIGLGGMPANVEDIGMVYEYLEKAGPRSINGYPIFFSCQMLHKAQMPELIAAVEHYAKTLNTPPPKSDADEKST